MDFHYENGEKEFFTRAGAFGIDEAGTFINPANGMKVQGWMAETIDGQTFVNTAADPGDLTIPVGSKDPASATSEVFLHATLIRELQI